MVFWVLGNSQKSHGAKSGEYGGCGTICVEFLAKWSRRTSAVWDGALSWCKNHELSAQNIFWNGVEWSSWNANSVSKVSNWAHRSNKGLSARKRVEVLSTFQIEAKIFFFKKTLNKKYCDAQLNKAHLFCYINFLLW